MTTTLYFCKTADFLDKYPICVCYLCVIIDADLDVKLPGKNSISVDTFENNDINIDLEHGDCKLHNIKVPVLCNGQEFVLK